MIPKKIKLLLCGTQLRTDRDFLNFWTRSHPFLGGKNPQAVWNSGEKHTVKIFIEILKSGDGSMT